MLPEPQDQLDLPVIQALRGLQALQDLLEQTAQCQVLPDLRVQQVLTVQQDLLVRQVQPVLQAQQDLLVQTVQLVPQDRQVLPVLPEQLARQGQLVQQVLQF